METILKTPESVFCQQYDELNKDNDFLFFIAKGKCKVWIKDKFKDRYEDKMVRILESGMHFGVSNTFHLISILGHLNALQLQKVCHGHSSKLLHLRKDR